MDLLRSAKSGSRWSEHELLAFNIEVVPVDATEFFGNATLPQPSVSPTILNNLDMPDGPLEKTDIQFFQYLRLAEKASPEDPTVGDFTVFVLRMIGYDDEYRIIRTRKEIPFVMAGDHVNATVDVCVMNDDDYLLVVQENDRFTSTANPEPQLIAKAIAAFYQNDYRRQQVGLPPLASKLIPAIVMVGTAPIFYRIPVTQALVIALITKSYPEQTVVSKFVPPVPDQNRYADRGMRPLDNRRIALQCFEAFKADLN